MKVEAQDTAIEARNLRHPHKLIERWRNLVQAAAVTADFALKGRYNNKMRLEPEDVRHRRRAATLSYLKHSSPDLHKGLLETLAQFDKATARGISSDIEDYGRLMVERWKEIASRFAHVTSQ
jgi:hypothetical protein